MRVGSRRRAIGRLVATVALFAAIVGVTFYFVAYQGTLGSSTSSSTESSSATGTSSYESSSSLSLATVVTSTGAVYIRACNCTVDLHDYLPDYSTMQDLASKSQAIIIANVTSEDTIGADDSSEFGGPGSVPLVPVTNYNVTITTVLLDRGWGLVPGHWTIIPTLGGTFNHITLNVTGFPTLSVGTTYVFFLTDEVHSSRVARTTSPPQA
jgi:hypothetical protein